MADSAVDTTKMSEAEIEAMMLQQEEDMTAAVSAAATKSPDKAEFESFEQDGTSSGEKNDRKLDMLYDIQLSISIELGRRQMYIRDILELERGSIIEFEKLASEPVDILINGKKMAEGEVVVIDKHFGIRITTLIDPADRIKGLKK